MTQPGYPSGPGALAPSAHAPAGSSGRNGAIAAAALVLLAGVIGGVVMLVMSGSRHDSAVEGLARAPIGCTTTLDFARPGTFVVFVETRGTIGAVRGDCPNANRSYDYQGAVPDVEVDLVDLDGAALVVSSDRSTSYDAAGFVGSSLGRVQIDQAGEYLLTATSDVAAVVVTIGKDPDDASSMLTVGGWSAIAAGLVVGGVMLVLALRRPRGTGPGPMIAGSGAPVAPMQPAPPTYGSPVVPSAPYPPATPPRAVPGTFAPPTQVQPTQPPPGSWPQPPTN